VLAALEKFPGVRPDPEAFIEALEPLQPRLYSISSSPKATPGRLSLTVDAVRYAIGRRRLGVARPSSAAARARASASASMCRRRTASACRPIPQCRSSWSGRAPASRRSAPSCTSAWRPRRPGRNWLFFGHQRSDCDFFYEDEFTGMKAAGVLTRLSLAWSRDGDQKSTCRTACARSAATCGRGSPTARTSTSAATPSAWRRTSNARWSTSSHSTARGSTDEAIAYVAELKKAGRYQQDVY
jgi:sulfite reductase (NADPH) flavoprotein alpha-component